MRVHLLQDPSPRRPTVMKRLTWQAAQGTMARWLWVAARVPGGRDRHMIPWTPESPDEWDPDSTELDASARARVMARASSTDSNAGQRPRGALLDAGGGGGKFCLGANAVNEEDPERDHATQV